HRRQHAKKLILSRLVSLRGVHRTNKNVSTFTIKVFEPQNATPLISSLAEASGEGKACKPGRSTVGQGPGEARPQGAREGAPGRRAGPPEGPGPYFARIGRA